MRLGLRFATAVALTTLLSVSSAEIGRRNAFQRQLATEGTAARDLTEAVEAISPIEEDTISEPLLTPHGEEDDGRMLGGKAWPKGSPIKFYAYGKTQQPQKPAPPPAGNAHQKPAEPYKPADKKIDAHKAAAHKSAKPVGKKPSPKQQLHQAGLLLKKATAIHNDLAKTVLNNKKQAAKKVVQVKTPQPHDKKPPVHTPRPQSKEAVKDVQGQAVYDKNGKKIGLIGKLVNKKVGLAKKVMGGKTIVVKKVGDKQKKKVKYFKKKKPVVNPGLALGLDKKADLLVGGKKTLTKKVVGAKVGLIKKVVGGKKTKAKKPAKKPQYVKPDSKKPQPTPSPKPVYVVDPAPPIKAMGDNTPKTGVKPVEPVYPPKPTPQEAKAIDADADDLEGEEEEQGAAAWEETTAGDFDEMAAGEAQEEEEEDGAEYADAVGEEDEEEGAATEEVDEAEEGGEVDAGEEEEEEAHAGDEEEEEYAGTEEAEDEELFDQEASEDPEA